MTEQELIDYLVYLQSTYYYDPVGFTKEVFKVEPTWQQAEIMNGIVKHRKVSVRSGHNIGKSAVAAFLTWWFECTRTFPKVICSANTKEQLHDVLWAEMATWRRANPVIEALFQWNKDAIYYKAHPADWWAVARTANKSEGIQGRHAPNQMIIVDEASGMDDKAMEATEGLMSGRNIYVLLISNPTRPSGYFYDTHMDERASKHWHPLHYSSLDSPLVDPAWLEFMKDKYGEDSPVYLVRVLGEFPLDIEDALIPRSWILDAIDRPIVDTFAPRVLGVDVGAGGDKTVILRRKGGLIEGISRYNTPDTNILEDIIAHEYVTYKADAACIDSIGIGWGASGHLQRRGFNIYPVDVRRKAFGGEGKLLRDDLWWNVRKMFQDGVISIPDDKDLQLELWSAKYKPVPIDKIKMESKAEMRRRIKYSPDSADALCLSTYIKDEEFYGSLNEETEEEANDMRSNATRNSFTGY